MLFNLFVSKTKDKEPRIFKDKVYIGSEAKMNACAELVKQQPDTLFIAWFSDTAKKFKAFFIEKGLDENYITEARLMHSSQIVYSAMDEPLFKHFGSDKMIPLIKLMGMKESESIEHSYVTESIVKGQKKIADKVMVEQSANSQDEWMERNLEAPVS